MELIFQIFLKDVKYLSNIKALEKIVNYAMEKDIPYFALNLPLFQCLNPKCGYRGDIGDTCPICGGKITGTYTRVVGFLTKVDNWIPERREYDFPQRQFYEKVEL